MNRVNNFANIAYKAHQSALSGEDLMLPSSISRLTQAGLNDIHSPEDFNIICHSVGDEIGILMSWWLDSIACYLMAKKQWTNVKCFYYDIGQPYKDKELKAIYEVIGDDSLHIITEYKLTSKWEKYDWWDFIFPLRNMVLILDAAERIYWGEIYFGVVDWELKKEGCGDKGIEFIRELSVTLKSYPFPVLLNIPLAKMTKSDIVKWYIDNWYKKELHLTMSCLNWEDWHCWKCQSCLKKYLAFLHNGEELKTNSDVRLLKDLIKSYWERTSDNNVGEKFVKEMRESINLL